MGKKKKIQKRKIIIFGINMENINKKSNKNKISQNIIYFKIS